ncbi:MAG TPA: hypothetical protein VFP72_08380 [Kineosporiaceae bacterium]|nr:hypothetical protein [Kineosporiaceae bacterium]
MQTAAPDTSGTASPRRTIRVLLVPADAAGPVEVVTVADSARAISDTLGGYLLDDSTIGSLPPGELFTVYRADDVSTLADNPRAAALVARLGLVGRRLQARLRGPVLVAGLDPTTGGDLDVPVGILTAAQQVGLRITGPGVPPRRYLPTHERSAPTPTTPSTMG